jgi:long-subunit acyl-CoA synthetase (AMP-forming)
MDILQLLPRLSVHPNNRVITFEKGQVVERSHADVLKDIQATRTKLETWGVKAGMRVGIRAPNCYQWLLYDVALIELRAVTLGFTDDFDANTPEELRERYSLSLMLVSSKERERRDGAAWLAALDGDNADVRVLPQKGIPADGDFDHPWLIFSSGSSGGIKGLTMIRRGVEASADAFAQTIGPRPDDCLLLFLPISNFQQRMMYYAALWYGFDIIITEPALLFHALKDLRPTILIAPPTLYEAFETRFCNLPRLKQSAARILGQIARWIPIPAMREGMARLLFRDAYDVLGGRMRFMVTGMAPIKRSTLELFALMQLPLFETYGLTECGTVALNTPRGHRLGSVGRLLPGVKVDLAGDGEIIVGREFMTALGYFQCADGESERTFIARDRVATGDIGRFDGAGFLYLVGRKKEIVISAGGEKIHPEAIEAEIDRCPDVAKSVIFGDEGATFLVAVVLPKNPSDSEAKRRIESFIAAINERRHTMRVETVTFTDLAFSRENGFLRPNLKLDRKRIAERFRAEIASVR